MERGEEVEIGKIEEGAIVTTAANEIYFIKGEYSGSWITLEDVDNGKNYHFLKEDKFIFLLSSKSVKNLALSVVGLYLKK